MVAVKNIEGSTRLRRAVPYFGVRNLCKAHTPLIQLCVLILLAALLIAHRPCAAQSATDSAKSASVTLPPMPADADPAFEVATIKPSDAQTPHGTFFTTRGRHRIASNVTVINLLCYSYGLHTRQIVDGPAWLSTSRFEVDGVPNVEGHPNQ
jgi:hypothetical protein